MPRSRADVFGDIGQKRDDVVVGRALNLTDALDVELRAALDGRKVFARNLPGLASQNLDVEPDGELVLFRPNLAHRFAAVSANHDAMRLRTPALVVNAGGNDTLTAWLRSMLADCVSCCSYYWGSPSSSSSTATRSTGWLNPSWKKFARKVIPSRLPSWISGIHNRRQARTQPTCIFKLFSTMLSPMGIRIYQLWDSHTHRHAVCHFHQKWSKESRSS